MSLRTQIEEYIAKEMRLAQTPAYSKSASEQSYGILSLIKKEMDEIEFTRDPHKPHKTICCMHCGDWNAIDAEVQQAKKETIQAAKEVLK